MSDNVSPLEFVQEWRRKCSLFATQSNDEMASVLTRCFEVMIAMLKPNSDFANIERLLASLHYECGLSMHYDTEATDLRAMTYGLTQSLHALLSNMLIFHNLNPTGAAQNDSVMLVDGREGVQDEAVNAFGSDSSLPIIDVEAADFDNVANEIEINQSLTSLIPNESALNKSIIVFNTSDVNDGPPRPHRVVKEEDVKPDKEALKKRQGGGNHRSSAIEGGDDVTPPSPTAQELAEMDASKRARHSGKTEVQQQQYKMDFQLFDRKRVQMEEMEADESFIERKKVRFEPDKHNDEGGQRNETLDALDLVEGNECFVCKMTLKRSLKGYAGHINRVHRISLKHSGYMLVCECGEQFVTGSQTKDHDQKCNKLNFTVQRRAGNEDDPIMI